MHMEVDLAWADDRVQPHIDGSSHVAPHISGSNHVLSSGPLIGGVVESICGPSRWSFFARKADSSAQMELGPPPAQPRKARRPPHQPQPARHQGIKFEFADADVNTMIQPCQPPSK